MYFDINFGKFGEKLGKSIIAQGNAEKSGEKGEYRENSEGHRFELAVEESSVMRRVEFSDARNDLAHGLVNLNINR